MLLVGLRRMMIVLQSMVLLCRSLVTPPPSDLKGSRAITIRNTTHFHVIDGHDKPMHLANNIKDRGSRFSNCEKDQLDHLINLSLPIRRPEDT